MSSITDIKDVTVSTKTPFEEFFALFDPKFIARIESAAQTGFQKPAPLSDEPLRFPFPAVDLTALFNEPETDPYIHLIPPPPAALPGVDPWQDIDEPLSCNSDDDLPLPPPSDNESDLAPLSDDDILPPPPLPLTAKETSSSSESALFASRPSAVANISNTKEAVIHLRKLQSKAEKLQSEAKELHSKAKKLAQKTIDALWPVIPSKGMPSKDSSGKVANLKEEYGTLQKSYEAFASLFTIKPTAGPTFRAMEKCEAVLATLGNLLNRR